MTDGDILRVPHDLSAELDGITPASAEILYDDTNGELRYGDGSTAGGVKLAKKNHTHAGADITSGTVDGDRLPAMSATKKGAVPATGTPTGKYLKDDGTWASPSAGSGTVTNGDSHDHVGGDGAPITESALSLSDVSTGNATASQHGFLPKLDGNTTTYLRGDGTWATPAGGGGGVTDHGMLTGLSDDDHAQYHTDARGDARYAPLAKGVTNGDSHDHNGGDGAAITEAALSFTDVTTRNATTSMHGLLPKLGGGTTNFLRADGTWAAPPGGGGSVAHIHYNVLDYGAVSDNFVTDNTTAFANAIAAAATAGGGIVFVPAGEYLVGEIELLNRVWLVGEGMLASRLKLKNGANPTRAFVYNHVSTNGTSDKNAKNCAIMNLWLDCNYSNQTGSGDGIDFDTYPSYGQASSDDIWDPRHLIQNVWIEAPKGYGVDLNSLSETRVINVHVRDAQGTGAYDCGSDAFFYGCTAEGALHAGFIVSGSSVRLLQCKAFGCGNASKAGTTTDGHGFKITSVQGGVSLVNCEAQDNSAYGFYISGAKGVTVRGAVADSNNRNNTVGTYAGLYFWGNEACVVDIVTYERAMDATGNRQQYGGYLGGTNKQCHVEIYNYGYDSNSGDGVTLVTTSPIKTSSDFSSGGLSLKIGSSGDAAVNLSPAINAYVSPDPTVAFWHRYQMPAGNINVANAAFKWLGAKLRLTFIQDGVGGRNVASWGSHYKFAGGAAPDLSSRAAGKMDIIEFESTGSEWHEVFRSLNIG